MAHHDPRSAHLDSAEDEALLRGLFDEEADEKPLD